MEEPGVLQAMRSESQTPLSNWTATAQLHLLCRLLLLTSSVQFSCLVMSDSLQSCEPQHGRPPCPSSTPGVHPNPCPLSWWCHPTISSSAIPFSFCLQSFPASWSFPMSWLFTSGGQCFAASASATVLWMNIQSWFPLGLTGLISLHRWGQFLHLRERTNNQYVVSYWKDQISVASYIPLQKQQNDSNHFQKTL